MANIELIEGGLSLETAAERRKIIENFKQNFKKVLAERGVKRKTLNFSRNFFKRFFICQAI